MSLSINVIKNALLHVVWYIIWKLYLFFPDIMTFEKRHVNGHNSNSIWDTANYIQMIKCRIILHTFFIFLWFFSYMITKKRGKFAIPKKIIANSIRVIKKLFYDDCVRYRFKLSIQSPQSYILQYKELFKKNYCLLVLMGKKGLSNL